MRFLGPGLGVSFAFDGKQEVPTLCWASSVNSRGARPTLGAMFLSTALSEGLGVLLGKSWVKGQSDQVR